jgi:hypothetical protein
MTFPMFRAWSIGFVILFVSYGAWMISLQMGHFSDALVLLLWCSPAISSFASAYFAPHKKVVMGASMAAPAALLAGVVNYVYEALGHAVDFPGYRGTMILVVIALVWSAILCTLGGIAGNFLAQKVATRGK